MVHAFACLRRLCCCLPVAWLSLDRRLWRRRLQTIETVTVTAEKRVENLHDVAIAATVVDSTALQNSGVVNADFLGEVVPTLNFKKGTSNINSTVSLRGIGTQSFAAGAEPSVSTVVDGVVYARSGMAFSEFIGLNHIEVLPGPQGTLFGKNASAGVVNIVTKGPTLRISKAMLSLVTMRAMNCAPPCSFRGRSRTRWVSISAVSIANSTATSAMYSTTPK